MPLHDDVARHLAARAAQGFKDPNEVSPQEARNMHLARGAIGPAPFPVGDVRDFEIAGPTGPLKARTYYPPGFAPRGAQKLPTIYLIHGGGFTTGSLDTQDAWARKLCAKANIVVFATTYRLSPENKFPAAVEDAYAGLMWAVDHVAELGGDATRIGVGGSSAGGNLAAVTAWMATENGIKLKGQVLIYPATDASKHYPSVEKYAKGYLLTAAMMEWFHDNYAGHEHDRDPRRSPMFIPDMSNLPAALVITAEFDPLRDEGNAYAMKLAEAGVDVTLRVFKGTTHAFTMFPVPTAQAGVDEMAKLVAILLG